MDQKPTFTALERSLVGNDIVEAGTTGIVLPEGTMPGPNMQPENEAAQALVDAYAVSERARIAKMIENNQPAAGVDTDAFAKAVGAAIAEANARHAEQMASVNEALAAVAATQKLLAEQMLAGKAPAPAAAEQTKGKGKAAQAAPDEPLT